MAFDGEYLNTKLSQYCSLIAATCADLKDLFPGQKLS
jgi:hypothetical protein